MLDDPMAQACPTCGVPQEPVLVIRSSGVPGNRWVFRCGSCEPARPYQGALSAERLRRIHPMEDVPAPPPLLHDVNFEDRPGGYEVWLSDRITEDHPCLVDQCAERLEGEVGVVNLGQVDHKCLLADGVLTNQLEQDIVAWWVEKVTDLDQGLLAR